MSILSYNELNEEQKLAVCDVHGPTLIMAGAGTGKTRVLTHRIMHIIDNGYARPHEILAVTFSNRAAYEIERRINCMINAEKGGDRALSSVQSGTFHSIAASILRQSAHLLGEIYSEWKISRDFVIMNEHQSIKIIHNILLSSGIKDISHYQAHEVISFLKDKLYYYNEIPKQIGSQYPHIKGIYREYQRRLSDANAMDFGDLILFATKLLSGNTSVCQYYNERYKYVLVDEYQDTSFSQYAMLKIITQLHNNVCCIGDPDQSIYSWRGALVTNIFQFKKDYNDHKSVVLKKNYRSDGNIIAVANSLISHNSLRYKKSLEPVADYKQKVCLHSFHSDKNEVYHIILDVMRSVPSADNTAAILVRAGHQIPLIERMLNLYGVEYDVVGADKFYDKKEILDILSYLLLLHNNTNNFAFERIVNTPKRGIGPQSLDKLRIVASQRGISLYNAASMSQSAAIINFMQNMQKWSSLQQKLSLPDLVQRILADIGYLHYIESSNTNRWNIESKIDNIHELLVLLEKYSSLNDYIASLGDLANHTNSDNMEGRERKYLQVMTIHTAKGLEFDRAFLPGWEEDILPSKKSLEGEDIAALEEERRLAYVAVTRARRCLHISWARNRNMFGSLKQTVPSRFVRELSSKHCKITTHK